MVNLHSYFQKASVVLATVDYVIVGCEFVVVVVVVVAVVEPSVVASTAVPPKPFCFLALVNVLHIPD